jgi:predicted RecB family nuclease
MCEPIAYRTRSKTTQQPWISVTELDNFCHHDLLADWCSVTQPQPPVNNATAFLFQKGKEHEDYIIQTIRDRTGMPLEKCSTHQTSRMYTTNDGERDMEHVIQQMKNGEPIIYSAYVHDTKQRIRGIPDLLVRNDKLSVLFPEYQPTVLGGTSRFGNYYYLPVEIKFSTIHLASDQLHVTNIDRTPFYKTQLYGYATLLQTIQDWCPPCAFIIGKRTVTKKGEQYHSYLYPGKIDYTGYDIDFITTFHSGIEWLKRVKTEGASWSTSQVLSYAPPFMKHDSIYGRKKKELAPDDITEIWRCGIQQRELANENGIYSWRDPRLTAEMMRIPATYQRHVDAILSINRGDALYRPTHLNTVVYENEMFVDFETLRDTFTIRQLDTPEFIFLIGVQYQNRYHTFRLRSLTKECEREVMDQFYQFWVNCGKPVCWFWYAERELWKRAEQRHGLTLDMNWHDVQDLIYQHRFVVKGCKNFKLKSYVEALSSLDLIPSIFLPETCENGMEAMIMAWKYYKETPNEKDMNEIITYNHFDCISLQYMLTFLRTL